MTCLRQRGTPLLPESVTTLRRTFFLDAIVYVGRVVESGGAARRLEDRSFGDDEVQGAARD